MNKKKLFGYALTGVLSFASLMSIGSAKTITYMGKRINDTDCVAGWNITTTNSAAASTNAGNCTTYLQACRAKNVSIRDICEAFGYSYTGSNYNITYNTNNDTFFNENSSLCSGSNGSTSFGWGDYSVKSSDSNKSYGALQVVQTHPGGHYAVSFPFSASISMTYLSAETCAFVKVNVGEGHYITCSEGGASSGFSYGAPNFGSEWSSHPSTVTLYDSTDSYSIFGNLYSFTTQRAGATGIGSSVVMTYRSLGSSSSVGAEIIRAQDVPGLSSVPGDRKSSGAKNIQLYENSSGSSYEHTTNENNEDEMYELDAKPSSTFSHSISGTISGETKTGTCGGGKPSCPTKDVSSCSWSGSTIYGLPVSSYKTKVNTSSSYNSYKTCDTCKRDDGSTYECNCCTTYTVSCSYSCSGTVNGTTTAYYRKHYSTASASENGIYEISTLSTNISNRIEAIREKFIPTDTLTGHYLYYITDNGSSNFGTRACDLIVKSNDVDPPNLHWSDLIRYRSVDVNNLFPNRSPGRNWVGFDKSIVASNNDSMYTITLTSVAMKNIAKSSNLSNYVNWKLPSTYRPIDEYGFYNSNGDYWSDFGGLSNIAGVSITRNKTAIIKRNTELVSQGYNKYRWKVYDSE